MHRALLLCVLAVTLAAQLPEGEWRTDLSRKSIDLKELHISLAKDAIPAIDRPTFTTTQQAATWMDEQEPVMVYEGEHTARAYPIQILLFHELVNDTVDGRPILVSYCPLCNSGVIFDRTVAGAVHDFGVAGLLRHSDMVMYDRQTDSLWQQVTGEAIVGTHTGRRLTPITGQMVAFAVFAATFPGGEVLDRPAGSTAPYGTSLYTDYEYGRRGLLPAGLPHAPPVAPLERVVTVSVGGKRKAYTFESLRRSRVYEDRIGDQRFVIFFSPEMRTAMDKKNIADSRAVGAAGVFSLQLNGKRLRFMKKKGRIIDKGTRSTWNVLGRAIDGPLSGQRLTPVPHGILFAFAVSAFHPDTRFIGVPPRPDELFNAPGPRSPR